MKNNYKNSQLILENSLNKSVFKKIEEILLILKIQIIKNNDIVRFTENIYYKIYNIITKYILDNINNYDVEQLETNINKIINNFINHYKKEN